MSENNSDIAWDKEAKLGLLVVAVFALAIVGGLYAMCGESAEERDARLEAEAETARVEAEADAEREAEVERLEAEAEEEEREKRKKGWHCLSVWDGSHRDVVRQFKRFLRDTDSFEHVDTHTSWVNDDGKHTLTTKFRSRNGFGGMMLGRVQATIDNETCEAILDLESLSEE